MLSSRTLHEVLICSSRAFLKSEILKIVHIDPFFSRKDRWKKDPFSAKWFGLKGRPIRGGKKKIILALVKSFGFYT